MTSVCEICGREFRSYPSRLKAGKDKYCSRACAYVRPTPAWEPRFWSYINKTDSCWIWTGTLTRGYGVLNANGHLNLAHRLSYELTHGPISDDLCVLHHCDTPACVNPVHLFLGTRTDNAADKVSKGRQSHSMGLPGASNPAAKLTQADVDEIRLQRDKGARNIDLAVEFGVNKETIGNIVRRVTWKDS